MFYYVNVACYHLPLFLSLVPLFLLHDANFFPLRLPLSLLHDGKKFSVVPPSFSLMLPSLLLPLDHLSLAVRESLPLSLSLFPLHASLSFTPFLSLSSHTCTSSLSNGHSPLSFSLIFLLFLFFPLVGMQKICLHFLLELLITLLSLSLSLFSCALKNE